MKNIKNFKKRLELEKEKLQRIYNNKEKYKKAIKYNS